MIHFSEVDYGVHTASYITKRSMYKQSYRKFSNQNNNNLKPNVYIHIKFLMVKKRIYASPKTVQSSSSTPSSICEPFSGLCTFFSQLYKVKLLVFLWLSNVRRHVWVLGRFKVWPPPVADDIFYNPILFDPVLPAQRLRQ